LLRHGRRWPKSKKLMGYLGLTARLYPSMTYNESQGSDWKVLADCIQISPDDS